MNFLTTPTFLSFRILDLRYLDNGQPHVLGEFSWIRLGEGLRNGGDSMVKGEKYLRRKLSKLPCYLTT